jgi:hypothetical protein
MNLPQMVDKSDVLARPRIDRSWITKHLQSILQATRRPQNALDIHQKFDHLRLDIVVLKVADCSQLFSRVSAQAAVTEGRLVLPSADAERRLLPPGTYSSALSPFRSPTTTLPQSQLDQSCVSNQMQHW